MWSGIKTRFNLNKYSFLLIGIFVFILLAASLFTAQYIYSSPFTRTSASSIYAYRLNNIQKNEGSVLGIMGKKNETGFENLMFGNRKSGMAGFYLSDKNGVEMKLEVDKKIQNGEVMPVTSKGKDGEAIVTYKDIAKDTDFIYKTTTSQIKEEIIINTREAAENAESYIFNLSIEGLTYQKNQDNTVIPTFTSIKDRETTYTIPPAFMIDSKGNKSYGVTTKITEDISNPNNLIIELTPNKTWLTSDDRQFPIIIDPTLIKGNPPILSLNFDEGYGQTTQDWSTNNNDGTLGATSGAESSDPTWKKEDDCVFGKCLYFDGSDDVVTFSSFSSIPSGQTARTISLWVKPFNINPGGSLVHWGNGASAGQENILQIINVSGTTYLFTDGVNVNNNVTLSGSEIPPANIWSHIAFVFDGTNAWTYYLNGIKKKQGTFGTTINTASATVMNVADRTDTTQANFPGIIDGLKIYNYARTVDQIKQDLVARGGVMGVAAQFGPDTNRKLSDGLVGYWKMDESATPSTDSSGNGNSGTWNGNTAATSGKFGSGASFDGTGDYVSVADSASLDISNQITVSAWVKSSTTNPSSLDTVLAKGDGTYRIHAESVTKDAWMFDITTSSGTCRADAANGSITTSWQHLVGVYDGRSCYLYIDGQQVSANTLAQPSTILTDNYALWIGNNSQYSSRDISAVIDDVRIYNRAFSGGEVRSLYNFAPGPVGHWKMDEISGTRYDTSGNNKSLSDNNSVGSLPGKFGNSASFISSNSTYLAAQTGSDYSMGAVNYTISGWIKINSDTTGVVMSKDNGSSAKEYNLWYYASDDTLNFQVYDGASTTVGRAISSALSLNTWYFVTAGYDLNLNSAYVQIDNNPRVYNVLTGTPGTNSTIMTVGARSDPAVYFYGQIDDLKIYNYIRTPAQITEDMNGGHPAPGSPVGSAVGHWRFDEGYGSVANNSGSGGSSLNGTITDSTWTNDGKFGKALNFDGSGDYVSLGDSSVLQPSNVTVSTWFNTSMSGTGMLLRKRTYGYLLSTASGVITFSIYNSSATLYSASSTSAYNDGAWHHAVGVYDGSYVYLYIDGRLVGKASAGTIYYGADAITVGRDGSSPNPYYFTGKIDEVKIYNFGLTEDQVKTEYNQGKAQVLGAKGTESDGKTPSFSTSREYCVPGDTSTCNPPVAVYKLDEDTGTTANNSMGGSYTGTLTNSPTWTIGKYGKGVNFDGSNDYIVTGNSFNPSSAYSVSMWAYLRTTNTDDTFFSSSTSDTTNLALYIGDGANNNLNYCNDGTCSSTSGSVSNVLTDGVWQHITFTYNGSGASRFYVNGEDVTSDGTNGELSDTGNKIFGNYDTVNNLALDGVLDEIRVYDYVRTPAQIAWEYNRGAPAAHYKFNECSGSTIQDWSPNANGGYNSNDGTLNFGLSPTIGDCTTSSTAWYNGAEGKINASMSFDGTDDEVIITDTTNSVFDFPSGQEMTVSAWVNPSNLPGVNDYASIFSKAGTNGNGYYAQIQGNGALEFCIFNTGGGGCYTTTRTPVTTSAWQHLTYSITVGNASTMRIYYNGQLLSGSWNNDGSTIPAADNATVNIGSSGSGSEPFNGRIDDLRLYRYTATQNQINTIMNDSSAVRFK